nr:serine hydrolase [Micromonospora sp. NBRC 107566]
MAPLGGAPILAHNEHRVFYAASTMKVAVLAALYRSGIDLDAPVPVRNDHACAVPGAARFSNARDEDQDDDVWERLGGAATPRWLATHMIVRSGNLATNLVLGLVGLDPVAEVWRAVGARHSVTGRGIEDAAARAAGIDNLVTAYDLCALFTAIATDDSALASPTACAAMLEVLCAQEFGEALAAGLPAGTRVAHKDGWVNGIRHGAGVVFPPDALPYAIAVCTGDLPDGEATALITRVSAHAWAARGGRAEGARGA